MALQALVKEEEEENELGEEEEEDEEGEERKEDRKEGDKVRRRYYRLVPENLARKRRGNQFTVASTSSTKERNSRFSNGR